MSETFIAGRILFIGAHCDDIEIGCGGTAAKFVSKSHPIAFATATLPQDEKMAETRRREAINAAALLGLSEQRRSMFFGPLLDGDLNRKHKELREWLKAVAAEFRPDTVFVHRAGEHSDHIAIHDVSKGVFENKNVFLYCIPRQAPDTPFVGTCGIAVSDFIETKIAMCECHSSQRAIYISRDSVVTTAHNCYLRWYGATKMREDGYAEEFILRAWRDPIDGAKTSAIDGSLLIPDELQLVIKPDGTFIWED